MNIILIFLGAVLMVVGIVRSGNSGNDTEKPAAEQTAPTPKANDMRVVLRNDGTYVVETYIDWPEWRELGSVPGYKNQKDAEELAAFLRPKKQEPKVVYP
jgi:hypothetical protein